MPVNFFRNTLFIALLISLNAHAQTRAKSNPCTSEQDGLKPLSSTSYGTVHTALGSLKIFIDGSGQTMVEKPAVIDYTTNLYKILNNSSDPNYQQVAADYTTAVNLMTIITGAASNSNPPTGETNSKVKSSAGMGPPISNPIPIHPVPVAPANSTPTNYQQLGALLVKNQGISQNSKYFLLSLIEGQLQNQWSNAKYRTATLAQTLTQEFTALQNPFQAAGLCGPIHTMGAFVAKEIGLGDVGMLGADDKVIGIPAVGHAIAFYKDPKTKKYVFVNYKDLSETQGTSLSVAALEQAHNMAPYTSSVYVETNTLTNPQGHLMEPQLTQNLTGAIEQASAPGQPNISVEVGSLKNSVVYQHALVGTKDGADKLTAFGVAQENREQPGDAVQDGAAGLGVSLQKTVDVNKAVSVDAKFNLNLGVFRVHDQTPAGDAIDTNPNRSAGGFIGTTNDQVTVNVDKGKNNLAIGAQLKMDEAAYTYIPSLKVAPQIEAGAPYDRIRVSVSDAPTPNLEVHANSDSFLYTKSLYDQGIALHPMEQNAGVTVQKTVDNGNVAIKNSVDGYSFGSIASGALGVRDESAVSVQAPHGLTVTATGEVASSFNNSDDDYNTHPTTESLGVSVDKTFKDGTLDVHYQYSSPDKIDYDMSEGALNPTLAETPPRDTFGATWTFGKPKN